MSPQSEKALLRKTAIESVAKFHDLIKNELAQYGGYPAFQIWLTSLQIKKFKRSTMYGICQYFNDLTFDHINESEIKIFNEHANKITEFEKHVHQFCNASLKKLQAERFHKYWNVYFFWKIRSMPKIGKAVIIIDDQERATLENVPDEQSESYSGKYWIEDKIICFDFKSNISDKTLYIKCHFVSRYDEIMLGAYITTDNNRIVHGSLVFNAVNSEEKPAVLSYKNSSFNNIPIEIRKYLSIKWRNYFKVPNPVSNLQLLNETISYYNESWEHRFIETEKPTIYFAMPTLALSTVRYNKFRENLMVLVNSLCKKYQGSFNFNQISTRKEQEDLLSSRPDLNLLSTSRLFILIVMKHEGGSFAMVQLGWALAHCKHIVVFYEEGSITGTILRLSNTDKGSIVFHSRPNIGESWNFIRTEIEKKLNSF